MAPSYLPYEEKLQRLYGTLREPVLLKKDWARELPGLGRVPRFVGEFLLAAGVGRGRALVEVVDELNRLHPPPGEHGRFRHRLVVEGELTLLDFLDVQVDTETGLHLTALPSLRLQPVEVPAELAMQHPGLVSGGLWGRVSLSWDPRRRAARLPPTYVTAFQPVQVSVSLDTFLEGRAYLTTAEWVDVLLASAGYDPRGVVQGLESEAAVRRRKLLLLTRLCPLVEGNLNLVEFGPKNTGKTYLLRSLTPRAYVVSGGRATAATLFEHLGNGRLGLLATRRVVVFDEIARLRFGSPEIVGILKDYMESGTFGRGRETVASDCSLLFTGNIDVDGDAPSPRYRHLAEPLPFELRDSAFLDRIHGYLPGWGLPKLNPEVLAGGIGFVSDFFGEALLKLRGFPFATTYARLAGRAPLPGMTQRDVAAVEKISRALTKLVFPLGAGPWDDDWVADVFRLAAELRQIVHDQLCRLAPGEFRPHAIGWSGGERAEPQAASPLRLPRLRPGEAYLLDRQPLPEGAECRLRRIEVLANDGGDGLSFGPGFDRDAVRAVERAYRYLRAEARALGLAHPRFREAGWTVAVEGREPVAAGVGLPVVLAFLTLASGAVPPEPLVAVGDVSLHGDLVAPEDLAERLQYLPELAAGGILVLPEPVPEGPRSGWTLISAPTLAHLLAALRR